MNIKIVADSSANLHTFEGLDFRTVPLKILTESREYVDDATLDTAVLFDDLANGKGRTSTSCPNVGEWLDAFGDAQEVFTLTITSKLSGSYNASVQAAQVYMEKHPDRKVCCLDSLSAGPELALTVEKLKELIDQGLTFDEIKTKILSYMENTHLLFTLKSLDNLAKNGRVSPLAAKALGLLNIHVVGKANEEGVLHLLHKCRGQKKAMEQTLKEMITMGYCGHKVRITHSLNEEAAKELKGLILAVFPNAPVDIAPNTGLCGYYTEKGGIMVGFECF